MIEDVGEVWPSTTQNRRRHFPRVEFSEGCLAYLEPSIKDLFCSIERSWIGQRFSPKVTAQPVLAGQMIEGASNQQLNVSGHRCLDRAKHLSVTLPIPIERVSVLAASDADSGINVNNKKTVGFQQIALNAEAVSNSWTLKGYGLIPVGDVEQRLNSVYDSGAMNTYGLDAGYFITPVLKASVGYYYQHRDQEDVDGSGVRGRLAYEISSGLTAGVNISYDEAFDTRFSFCRP